MNKQDIVVDLLRHGEPVGGRAYRGNSIDDPLTEKGWAQMRLAVKEADMWDKIVTSPLTRCREFADELGQQVATEVLVQPAFREVGFGEWEGKTPDEVVASDAAGYEGFYRDPENCRPAGAEPLKEFTDRVVTAYRELVEKPAGGHMLIVTHAGVIRAIIAHVLGAPPVGMYRININNAGISRIRHTRHGPRLEFHNLKQLPESR